MIKSLASILTATTLLSTPAIAADWTGFYGGVELGYAHGESSGGGGTGSDNAFVYGLIAGYDYDLGNWVIGAGIDYDWAEIGDADTKTIRVKGRAGYKLGEGLLYATAGWANLDLSISGVGSADDNGYVIGMGYDYKVSDNFSVGGELLYNRFNNFNSSPLDIGITTLQVRAAYRF